MDGFLILWFILLFWIIGANLVRYAENENSPVVTVPARVVGKRKKFHGKHHSFHITFHPDIGEEVTLKVPRSVYRALNEGNRGTLTYQGTRFLDFTL